MQSRVRASHLTLAPPIPQAPLLPGGPAAPLHPRPRRSAPKFPIFIPTPSRGARARVAALTDECWRCRTKVRAIVGVLIDDALTPDGSGFLPLHEVDEALAAALDSRTLAARRIGELRHRESPGVAGGYIANGCIECDALIGRFRVEDLLTEHRVSGGGFAQLDVGIGVELALQAGARPLSALG
jgi:hypothetical protein